MRILMLAQFYPPTVGGEERHVQDLSTALVSRGHDVAVATLWHEGLPKLELDQGVRVYRISGTMQRANWLFSETGRRHAPPFPDPELMLALRGVLDREQPQIVHAHNWLVHSFLPLKALSRAKLVMSLHDYSLVCAKKSLVYHEALCDGPGLVKCLGCASDHYGSLKGVTTTLVNWGMALFERSAVDIFLTVSQTTAAGNGLVDSPYPFQVIPNFVPDDIGTPSGNWDNYMSQLPAEPFLLFVGDLRRFKGIEVLLRAYASLQSAPPLVLIGRICADTPSEFPSNVLVLGSWPHGAVMAAWHRSLMGLLPSIGLETFGIAALEAMASSRPVIASRIGGLSDVIVDGETGYLVPPGDQEALRQAIESLLADPDLRARMGQAAKRRTAEFHASRVVSRIEDVYRQVLQGSLSARAISSGVDEW